MLRIIKKSLAYILTGSFTIILAACYGTPVEMEYTKTIKTTDDNENPIAGLKVTLSQNGTKIDSATTDNAGFVDFYDVYTDNQDYEVSIQDVDGNENLGIFKDSVFDLNSESYYNIKLNKQ
jgi:FlaG/FlaF family flagellin (archaellin)